MKLTTEQIYFAIAGALVGIGYMVGKAWWGGDLQSAFTTELAMAAAAGAGAGVLACLLRGSGK
ncbi:MAG: hypothetical protein KDJ37_06585 [Hyphomicrobiaceae bacterium]|nr:hypothetical protein [Hyphomicrobiaceae bacterium]